MSAAFSDDGSAAIERSLHIEAPQSRKSRDEVETFYEIKRCSEWILQRNLQKVALQFPDELLLDSVAVCNALTAATTAFVFVLGDTSYGSCCVDEVTADRCNADGLIHFGHACLSQTDRIPILYIFGRSPVDIQHCCDEWRALVADTDTELILICDVIYRHAIEALSAALSPTFLHLAVPEFSDSPLGGASVCGCRLAAPELRGRSVLYVGGEGGSLSHALFTLNAPRFYSYDPAGRVARAEVRRLGRRYHLVERVRDARVVAVLVGTLAVHRYRGALRWLRAVLRRAGKRVYTLAVGRPNAAKLANFGEVDVFVLVGCAERSLVDGADLYRPVVTPYEVEVACNAARRWTGEYVTDFNQLLPGGSSYVPMSRDGGPTTDVSLITGVIRRTGIDDDDDGDGDTAADIVTDAVACRQEGTVATSQTTAAEYLASRSFRGLDPKLGETPVTGAVEGISGIASGYTHEPS